MRKKQQQVPADVVPHVEALREVITEHGYGWSSAERRTLFEVLRSILLLVLKIEAKKR